MENNTFKEKLKRLEEIVAVLENDQIDLENSLQLFEEGLTLVKSCNATLLNLDTQITTMIQQFEEKK